MLPPPGLNQRQSLSEGFDDSEDDDGKQEQHGDFVEPSEENMATDIAPLMEVVHQFSAVEMVDH